MPPRSKVEQLPAELKAWLDARLVENGFSGYDVLEAEINDRLTAAGAGFTVGKSSIHRYGADFSDRLKALKLVSEQAKAVIEGSQDDEDAVSQALIRMTQEKLFNVVLDMQVDPKSLDLAKMTRAIADLSRASISNKRFASEVKARAAAAADEVGKVVKQAGLSPETADLIRRQILGIAG
ncbi:DUF3486 family protein [Pseudoduganella sp. RAF53_2]|uniref:DUF3486 family protein n=1 Tax=unclassified Pseudoduganella TaxID=2637179 RepID=UPI003F955C17